MNRNVPPPSGKGARSRIDSVRADLGQRWDADLASAQGALLNAIACDDPIALRHVLTKGLVDVAVPIDVCRVRATTAPNYVCVLVPSDADRNGGRHHDHGGVFGRDHALLGYGHTLPGTLQPLPLVIAAISHASSCVRELVAHGSPIGGASAALEHLLEAVIPLGTARMALMRAGRPLPRGFCLDNDMVHVGDLFRDVREVIAELLTAFSRSRPLPAGALNPLSAVRRVCVAMALAGASADAVRAMWSGTTHGLLAHGYDARERVCDVPHPESGIRARFVGTARECAEEETACWDRWRAANAAVSESQGLDEQRCALHARHRENDAPLVRGAIGVLDWMQKLYDDVRRDAGT